MSEGENIWCGLKEYLPGSSGGGVVWSVGQPSLWLGVGWGCSYRRYSVIHSWVVPTGALSFLGPDHSFCFGKVLKCVGLFDMSLELVPICFSLFVCNGEFCDVPTWLGRPRTKCFGAGHQVLPDKIEVSQKSVRQLLPYVTVHLGVMGGEGAFRAYFGGWATWK